jgi:hypothetical protein
MTLSFSLEKDELISSLPFFIGGFPLSLPSSSSSPLLLISTVHLHLHLRELAPASR